MPKHSKHRPGCDCLIQQPATAQGDDGVCLPNDPENTGTGTGTPGPADSAHCAYVAVPLCDLYTRLGEKYAEKCVALIKRCVTGNEYVSRWSNAGLPTDEPLIPVEGCDRLLLDQRGFPRPCDICTELKCLELCVNSSETFNVDPQCSDLDALGNQSFFSDWFADYDCATSGTGPQGFSRDLLVRNLAYSESGCFFTSPGTDVTSEDPIANFKGYYVWILELSGGTATLRFRWGGPNGDFSDNRCSPGAGHPFDSTAMRGYQVESTAAWDCVTGGRFNMWSGGATIDVTITPSANQESCNEIPVESSSLLRLRACCSLPANYGKDCDNTGPSSSGVTGTGTVTAGAAGTGTVDPNTCKNKWKLTAVPNGYSTLEVSTVDGESALFSDAAWQSNRWRTFARESMTDGLAGLPSCICVGPIDTRYETPCNPAIAQCRCCLDFRCGVVLYLAICGRSPVQVPMSILSITPTTGTGGGDTGLCGVDDPQAPCPIYWGEYELGLDACITGEKLGFLVWCDGSENGWHVYVYCYNTVTECWDFQQDAIQTKECLCNGIHFTFQITVSQCICCCPSTTCEDLPDTLTADLAGGLLCGCGQTIDSITLTRVGATNAFTGTGPFGSCGRNITLTFNCATPCENATLDHSFSDACESGFETFILADCACDEWLFVSNDLVSCVDGGGPCFVSVAIHV